MESLNGMVTMVTGGGRGLGEQICHVLADAGATIAAADLCLDWADKVGRDLNKKGHKALAVPLDVGDESQVNEAIGRVLDSFGRIDAIVNNAGVDYTLSAEEMTYDQWDRVIRTNLRGPFLTSKCAMPIMRKQGGGHIVNIVSTAAKRAWPNASAYHASKWGLLGLSYALHTEGRPHGVKVTAIVTGGMRTPFLLDRFPDIDLDTLQDPKNVAETVRFCLTMPKESVIPELMVLPMRETSWP